MNSLKMVTLRDKNFTTKLVTQLKIVSGFTLIELLIVVALLAVLGSVVMVSFTSSQRSARDANRKSDLSQFRDSLEAYANNNTGIYPVHASVYSTSTLCSADLALPVTCPVDPRTGAAYTYVSDGGGTKYLLYASLEKMPAGFATYYFGLCSTGSSIAQQAVPTIASCP